MADYALDTRNLSLMEHGAYSLLLDAYYANCGPLLANAEHLENMCGARTSEEKQAIATVCKRFFTEVDGMLVQKRAEEEIERRRRLSETRASAAKSKSKHLSAIHSTAQHKRKPFPSSPKGDSGGSSSVLDKQGGKVQEGGANGSDHPSIDDPVVEKIPLVDGSEFEVRQSLVAELDRAYPAVEPVQTLRELRAWNVANPQYRKTKAGATRHINAWFAKEQNRASARQGQGGR